MWVSLATLIIYSVTELFNEVAFEWLIYVIGFLSGIIVVGKSISPLDFKHNKNISS
jgi:hypothetical protein